MLTPKQKELLLFINERLKESGVPPSYDEMKEALDLRSKSGIHRLITALEERGFIRRLPHRARALEVTRLSDDQMGSRTAAAAGNWLSASTDGGWAAVSAALRMRASATTVWSVSCVEKANLSALRQILATALSTGT